MANGILILILSLLFGFQGIPRRCDRQRGQAGLMDFVNGYGTVEIADSEVAVGRAPAVEQRRHAGAPRRIGR